MPQLKQRIFASLFVLAIILLSVISCQKDFSPDLPGTPPVVTQRTSVEGRVTDEAGLPVTGATIKAGISTTQTDKNGMFKIEGAAFTTAETFVTVTKPGYFKGSRTFFSRENSNNFITVKLLRKTITGRITASAGGDAEMNSSKGNVHFEPNSFVTSSGTNYNGTVLVATQYIDPSLPDVAEQMPGDLRGTTTAGGVVGLKSYGMIAVELISETGESLQIKDGYRATVTVSIPASQQAVAPATIPLWYFNDSTGLWKQEGTAIKNGDSYEGFVSHFSFWNCDDPYEYVKIKARIINLSGGPVSQAKVVITDGTGNSAYDYTDNNGYVDGFVPKNEPLSLKVLDACGQQAHSSNIGPYNVQTDLGNITLSHNLTVIQGAAINCTGGAVTDGYVQIVLNGVTSYVGIMNGNFSYSFINCQASSIAQITAVDNITVKQGSPVNVNISGATVNVGQLTACGVSSATFFNLTVGGLNLSANTAEYYRQGWKSVWDSTATDAEYLYASYDSLVNKYIYIGFTHPTNYVFTSPSGIISDLYMGYKGLNGSSEEILLSPVNANLPLNFTEYGSLGQFIAGTYSGQVVRESIDGWGNPTTIDTVNATFNFRVRHTTNPF